MMIKKFTGSSFKDALEQVKRDLGSNAMILSSRSIKTGGIGFLQKPMVEVTAAIDDEPDTPFEDQQAPSKELDTLVREVRFMREELGLLKETLSSVLPGVRISKEKKGLFHLLVKQGIDPQLAVVLLERSSESIDSLKKTISHDVHVYDFIPAEDRGFLFVGLPGAGKTTTLSKVAHLLREKRKHLSLITLDAERIAAIAHMKELSQQLNCDLKIARSVGELPRMIYKDIKKGPVLIDTPGTNYRKILEDVEDVFSSGFPLTRCFIMEATMDSHAGERVWQTINQSQIDTIGFTKLDIAVQYGSLYNLSLVSGRPLSFVSNGPSIPGDLRIPSPEYMAGLVIGGTCAN
jgi:flagellar biosynthesis protein FlhF